MNKPDSMVGGWTHAKKCIIHTYSFIHTHTAFLASHMIYTEDSFNLFDVHVQLRSQIITEGIFNLMLSSISG